jgi:hypothetical protein
LSQRIRIFVKRHPSLSQSRTFLIGYRGCPNTLTAGNWQRISLASTGAPEWSEPTHCSERKVHVLGLQDKREEAIKTQSSNLWSLHKMAQSEAELGCKASLTPEPTLQPPASSAWLEAWPRGSDGGVFQSTAPLVNVTLSNSFLSASVSLICAVHWVF